VGSYKTTVSEGPGKTASHGGHYLAVWRKGPDRTWKIAAYSATPVSNAPGARK
jgi:ketosteroid isomerase-like protein